MSFNRALNQLALQSSRTASLFTATLESAVNRYDYLPGVLASNPGLIAALRHTTARSTKSLSRALAKNNAQAGSLTIYVMSASGVTLSSSNYDDTDTFVGRNFSFRPYFKRAINGESGRYFALGTTSGKRGYYFSSPVRDPATSAVIGAVVVKVSLEELESNWENRSPIVLLTDQHGVVFSGNKKDWHFHSLQTLTPLAHQELQKSQQYRGKAIHRIPGIAKPPSRDEHRLLQITDEAGQKEYLAQKLPIPLSGWWLQTLSDTSGVRFTAWRDTISLAVLMSLIAVLGLYYAQRRRTWILLRQAKASLELRVQERTSALQVANKQLSDEAREKEAALDALKKAQDKLLHSSRLATIGEMSTAITHELSQPITAIAAYAQNAIEYLKANRPSNAIQNLENIESLTERMGEITTVLRNHARKSDDNKQTVLTNEAIDNAIAIVHPRLAAISVNISRRVEADHCMEVNQTRLEQILVNLLVNACDAVAESHDKHISICTETRDNGLNITVCDNGGGIPEEHLNEVFEPFFTTKGKSRGLGLGLSISQSIANSLNGSLSARNRPEGGACFCLALPLPATRDQ